MDPILLVIITLAFMLAMWANRDQNYGGVSQPSYKRCVSRVTGCMWVQIPPSLLKSVNIGVFFRSENILYEAHIIKSLVGTGVPSCYRKLLKYNYPEKQNGALQARSEEKGILT